MKKTLCFLLTLFAVFALFRTAEAEEKAELKTEYDPDTSTLTVSYYAPTGEAQALLDAVRRGLSEAYTPEQLESLPYSVVTKPVENFIVFHYGEHSAAFIAPGVSGKRVFSLYDEILPAFPENADFSTGGELTCEVLPATVNYPEEYSLAFFSVAVSGSESVRVPPSGRVVYDIRPGADNPNVKSFPLPLTQDILLENPSAAGCIFAGWTCSGAAADRVKAGTVNIKLKAEFTPREYHIGYVLTTDITYSFGRANNTVNPRGYVYGEQTPLYPIESPVGGYSFYGWYLNGEKITAVPENLTGDILVYARWVSDEEKALIAREEDALKLKKEFFCDLDSDGEITVSDARDILRAAIGLDAPPPDILSRADVFGSGTVTVANARIALRLAIGLENAVDVWREAAGNVTE